jgi:hypothetical protein
LNGTPDGLPRGVGVTLRVDTPCPNAGTANSLAKSLRVHISVNYR